MEQPKLPCRQTVGDPVTLWFSPTCIIEGCYVHSVEFAPGKVIYNVYVPYNLTGRNEIIIHDDDLKGYTLIRDILSEYVVDPGYQPSPIDPETKDQLKDRLNRVYAPLEKSEKKSDFPN